VLDSSVSAPFRLRLSPLTPYPPVLDFTGKSSPLESVQNRLPPANDPCNSLTQQFLPLREFPTFGFSMVADSLWSSLPLLEFEAFHLKLTVTTWLLQISIPPPILSLGVLHRVIIVRPSSECFPPSVTSSLISHLRVGPTLPPNRPLIGPPPHLPLLVAIRFLIQSGVVSTDFLLTRP